MPIRKPPNDDVFFHLPSTFSHVQHTPVYTAVCTPRIIGSYSIGTRADTDGDGALKPFAVTVVEGPQIPITAVELLLFAFVVVIIVFVVVLYRTTCKRQRCAPYPPRVPPQHSFEMSLDI